MAGIKPPKSLDFARARESWSEWRARFQRYRSATGLHEAEAQRQVDTLIFVMGEEAETIHAQLNIPDPLPEGENIYTATLTAFDQYFNPLENTLHYKILFSSRNQQRGETNEQFLRSLHEFAKKCGWNNDVKLDMMKTRILAGMTDKPLSRELQLHPDMTLEQITGRIRAKEVIEENQRQELDGRDTNVSVNSVTHARANHKRPAFKPKWKASGRDSTKSRGEGRGEVDESESGFHGHQVMIDCQYCGEKHQKNRCEAYGKRCNKCNKFNHFAKVCRSNINSNGSKTLNAVKAKHANHNESDGESSDSDNCFVINTITNSQVSSTKWLVKVSLNNFCIPCKVDTGAEVNVMPRDILKDLGVDIISKTGVKLTGYAGDTIPVIGKVKLDVALNQTQVRATFFVRDIVDPIAENTPLLGLTTVRDLGLIPSINELNVSVPSCKSTVTQYKSVFEGVGCHTNYQAQLTLREGAKPQTCRPRTMPLAVKPKLKCELDRLEQNGIIVRDTEPSEWLTPIVIVNKPNGSVRLCLDPQYLNTQLIRSQYTLPTVPNLLANIAGSIVFSCIDMKNGFHKLALDDASSKLTMFITPFGKYRYLRMPMGICNAPEVFHQTMVDTFSDIPGVEIYIDDFLIHAPTVKEHNNRLTRLLERCESIGLKLNKSKCQFGQTTINFLGHELSDKGVKVAHDKLQAIKDMTIPTSKKDTKRFLGFVNYLAKFIPSLSELTYPFREVCKDKSEFFWEVPQAKAYSAIKQRIIDSPTLMYYTPGQPVTISVDSSAHSIGAVLLQEGRPIEYASKSLSDCQQNYAQIEKELLAVVFGCQKSHMYIFGCSNVTIETDHKPLLGLCGKDIGETTARLASMRLRLLPYTFNLKYKPGKEMVLADTLLRSCSVGTDVHDDLTIDPLRHICSVRIQDPDVMARYQGATSTDEELSQVMRLIKVGWPTCKKSCQQRALLYWSIRHTLAIHDGLVFYGDRLVIPVAERERVLNVLHMAHQGVTKTLQRAKTTVFWPGLRRRVQDRCMSCEACMSVERLEKKSLS